MNHGLTGFETQVPVPGLPYHLDLGRRDLKVGVEYDGEYHRDPAQHAKDLTRWNRLRRAGWLVYPLTTTMVTRDEHATAADIRDEGVAVARSNLETELGRLHELGATADGTVG